MTLKKNQGYAKAIKEIESLVFNKGLSYIDAIVYYSEKNDIEIESMAIIAKKSIKIKNALQREGELLNLIGRLGSN